MPRINVLTGETPPPTLEAPPAKKKRDPPRPASPSYRHAIA